MGANPLVCRRYILVSLIGRPSTKEGGGMEICRARGIPVGWRWGPHSPGGGCSPGPGVCKSVCACLSVCAQPAPSCPAPRGDERASQGVSPSTQLFINRATELMTLNKPCGSQLQCGCIWDGVVGDVGGRGATHPLNAAAPSQPGQRSAHTQRCPLAQRGHPR